MPSQQSTKRVLSLSSLFSMAMFLGLLLSMAHGFVMPTRPLSTHSFQLLAETASPSEPKSASDSDPNEIIARKIIVEGDVQGGYYRSCVLNEAGRFRRLTGTMTPPDDTRMAEIYVEGQRKMVDGFVRWCKKSNVGLSQVVKVTEIVEADPTGLYDGFYCRTK